MEDTMEKIGKLLSDEESVKQLSELAQLLMNNDSSGENVPAEKKNCTVSDNNNNNNMPDIAKIMQLTELMGTFSQNDRNTDLLLALRPHLKEERQQRVDKAIKMLRLFAVWNVAKESGLLNDII
ncbi:MAG: hypothetical protein K2L10_02235 [Ruminococcus sp.]|nr:hypothetical protein [Ruminococcus sp.]